MDPNRARGLGRLSLSLAAGLVWLTGGCDPSFGDRFNRAFQTELLLSDSDTACGPIRIATLIPDCPVEGVCFTSACEAHNECYGTCGKRRKECDDQFFQDMVAICSKNISLTSPQFIACRKIALLYWLAVNQLGQQAYEETQALECPSSPIDMLPEQTGACCQAGSPPVCDDGVGFVDCPPEAVFLADLTCGDLDKTFGGCPVPPNDLCEDRTPICVGEPADEDLGRCAGDPQAERGGGVCSLTLQDCTNGLPCLPVSKGKVFRCTVETDNRLATTDGPPAEAQCLLSGEDSFQADVWYEYVAPCSGSMVIRMCDAITYDAMLAVFGTNQPDGTCVCPLDNRDLLVCDDDFCGGVSTVSGLTVEGVVEGACYTIRVGGFSSDGTADDARRGVSEIDIGMFCDEDAAPDNATSDSATSDPSPSRPTPAKTSRSPHPQEGVSSIPK